MKGIPWLVAFVFIGSAWMTGISPADDISIFNPGYLPQVSRIAVDTEVLWTNLEGVHTTTSRDGLWDSGVLSVNDTFSYLFDEVGCYPYYDTIHGWPSGMVRVVYTLAEISVSVDRPLYGAGDSLSIGLELSNPGGPSTVGVEIWVDKPDGGRIWLLRRPSVNLPAGLSFSDAAWRTFTVPAFPRGEYAVGAALVKMPEKDVICEDRAPFAIGVARQTDWSSGPSAAGPIAGWGEAFDKNQGLAWRSVPGQLSLSGTSLPSITSTVIADDADQPSSVAAGDLDGDGQIELITTDPVYDISNNLGAIYWWRQEGGSWHRYDVTDDFYGAHYADTSDVDGDGDLDVIAAAYYGDGPELGRNGRFAWFENLNGDASEWERHPVGIDMFWGADYIEAGDLDGDGDMDLAGASSLTDGVYEQDSDLTWFENLDGAGEHWGQHDLDHEFENAREVHPADIDGDGDLDLVGAYDDSFTTSRLAWWENANGDATAWTKHWIPGEFWGAGSCAVGDIDNDGDLDLLGSGYSQGVVIWWENLNGAGSGWLVWYITAWTEVLAAELEDLDGDGDLDGIVCSRASMLLIENTDGQGLSWTPRPVPGIFSHPLAAVADLDRDGKPEVVVCSETSPPPPDDQLRVLDTSAFGSSGRLNGAILDGRENPGWGVITWDADVPAGTSMSIQVRASNNPEAMGSFLTVPGSGYDLGGLIDPDARYFQYRVTMQSTDSALSPVLFELAVEKGESAP